MLPGLAPCVARPALPVAISHTDNAAAAAVAGVATFTSRAIGAASGDRRVAVAVSSESNQDVVGVTIDGVAATPVAGPVRNTGATPDVGSALYWLPVPVGTTATIAVTLGGSVSDIVGITVLAVTGGHGTVAASDADATNGASTRAMVLAAPANSGTIVVVGNNATTAVTWSGSAVIPAAQFNVGADRHAAAYRVDATATALSINSSAGINRALCAATFA